jgi:hypothetical protein
MVFSVFITFEFFIINFYGELPEESLISILVATLKGGVIQ